MENNRKAPFLSPVMELVTLAAADVIATSSILGEEDLFPQEETL